MPKWLKPIDPGIAEMLPVKFDPALAVNDDTAYRLQLEADVMRTEVTVFAIYAVDMLVAAKVIREG